MHRGLKSERRRVGWNVTHPPVGDHERAGDPIDGDVGQGRRQRAEQSGAIGFAVGLAGFDDAHLKPLDLLEAVDQRLLRLRGLAGALAEILAGSVSTTTAATDDNGSAVPRG